MVPVPGGGEVLVGIYASTLLFAAFLDPRPVTHRFVQ
jgi:hypothetical protein